MPTLVSSGDELITMALCTHKNTPVTVKVTLFIHAKIAAMQNIVSTQEGIKDLITLISSILDAEVKFAMYDEAKDETGFKKPLEIRDGCVAVDLAITSTDSVWKKIAKLQDQVYNPESELCTFHSSHKPCRVHVIDNPDRYDSPEAIYKEEQHLLLAARVSKQRFFQVAEEEIRARKVADRAFIVAEKAHEKLQQAFDMYTEVALNIKKPGHVAKAKNDLQAARKSVDDYVGIVSQAAKTAQEINRYETGVPIQGKGARARAPQLSTTSPIFLHRRNLQAGQAVLQGVLARHEVAHLRVGRETQRKVL
jgi:hypothetical protein